MDSDPAVVVVASESEVAVAAGCTETTWAAGQLMWVAAKGTLGEPLGPCASELAMERPLEMGIATQHLPKNGRLLKAV